MFWAIFYILLQSSLNFVLFLKLSKRFSEFFFVHELQQNAAAGFIIYEFLATFEATKSRFCGSKFCIPSAPPAGCGYVYTFAVRKKQ